MDLAILIPNFIAFLSTIRIFMVSFIIDIIMRNVLFFSIWLAIKAWFEQFMMTLGFNYFAIIMDHLFVFANCALWMYVCGRSLNNGCGAQFIKSDKVTLQKNGVNVRVSDCKNIFVSGSLIFCACCRRVIGHIDFGEYLLRDVRLMYFVPLYDEVASGMQLIYVRATERGPIKRKHVLSDWFDIYEEPLNKRVKYSCVQSVICARMHMTNNEMIRGSDNTEFFQPINFEDIIYESSDDSDSDSEGSLLEEYYSDSDEEIESDHESRSSVSFSADTLLYDPQMFPSSRPSTPMLSLDSNFPPLVYHSMPVGKCLNIH